MHTAMAAFRGKQLTEDRLKLAFALQYLARASLNRLLLERLAASGGVRIAGDVAAMFMSDLDDLRLRFVLCAYE
jgi:hypothetical protein